MSDDWTKQTACDLGRAIEQGKLDPVELTDAFLTAIRNNAFRTTIYARLTEKRAIAEAKAAAGRAKSKTRQSLLDGVPISWKDLFDTAGTATESGSLLLKGRVPKEDAEVLRNASNAGLVCLGKTHQTELAFSGLGVNPITATPPNSISHDLAPGGSSSGAAVSTAMGLAAAGIGSDTGGSVRIPSAWNNLVGLKTTSGLLSLKGVVPLCETFDTVGPLCRSVEDAAHLLAALAGTKPASLRASSIKGKHFALPKKVALENSEKEIINAFESTIEKLRDAGATFEVIETPEVSEALELSAILFTAEAYATWGEAIEKNPDVMFANVRQRFQSGKAYSAHDYIRSWQRLRELRKIYAKRTAIFDAVVMPTCAMIPPNAMRLMDDPDYFQSYNLEALKKTRIANLMGVCALTLPTGTNHVGFSLLGKPFGEPLLLRHGAAVEGVLRTQA